MVIPLMDLAFMLMKISFGNPAPVMKSEAIFVKDHQRVNILQNFHEIKTVYYYAKSDNESSFEVTLLNGIQTYVYIV